MKSRHVDMLNGSITKGLLSLTMPIMIMNVLQALFNIVDMTVLGKYSNDAAVGAVGACTILTVLSTSLLIGISSGANIIVARRIGEKNKERTDSAAMTSIILAVVGGIALMIVGAIFAEFFLKLTSCPESLLPKATIYFQMYFYGVPFSLLYNFAASILRATGDSKRPMYFLTLAGIVKVLLTVLFVTSFNMDVEGVALATIISNITSCSLALITIFKFQNIVHINLKKIKFDVKEFKDILYIGIPAGLQSAMYSVANVVITTAVNSFGAAATTGIAIANQFDGILYHIIWAPSIAVAPYVSQNVGAKNIARVKKTVVSAILITIAFGASFGSLSAIFSGELSSIMSSNPAVIAYSQEKMIIISSTYFICGINEVMSGVLRGLGKPIIPTFSIFVFMCLLRFVWVYVFFPLCPNFTFLYAVWPIGWVLSIITLLTAYFITMRKYKIPALAE